MGVVNIPDVEGGPVTAQASGAQSGKTTLVGQLRQGVVLIHELAQGGRAEELLDHRGDGPDVDQALGGDGIQILDGHPLPDHPIQTAKADAELVLQQLAHAAQAAVAQMVDVIGNTNAHGHTVQIVDGCQNIISDDVLGDQIVHALGNGIFPAFQTCVLQLLQHFLQHAEANLLTDAESGRIKVNELVHANHVVGEHLDQAVANLHHGLIDTLIAQLGR